MPLKRICSNKCGSYVNRTVMFKGNSWSFVGIFNFNVNAARGVLEKLM